MTDERKYKAYLTRRSKWEGIYLGQKYNAVGIVSLRERMIKIGEHRRYLDVAWEKRVLGDKKLFESTGEGFFVLTDEAEEISLGKRPEWQGERPGEDWVKDAYNSIVTRIGEVEHEDLVAAKTCLNSDWKDVSKRVVLALEWMKRRGIERPLDKLWEVSWAEAMATTASNNQRAQRICMWLMNTMAEVDAYKRLRVYLNGGERPADVLGPEDGHGSRVFWPIVHHASRAPDGSPKGVLEAVRSRLVYRGIMRERA